MKNANIEKKLQYTTYNANLNILNDTRSMIETQSFWYSLDIYTSFITCKQIDFESIKKLPRLDLISQAFGLA